MTNPSTWLDKVPPISLYVANSGSSDVTCIRTAEDQLESLTIPVASQPCGIAIHERAGKVYVTDGDEVTVINMRTQQPMKRVKVGKVATFPTFSPKRDRLYVPNFLSNTLSVLETDNDKVIRTIPVGVQPSHAVVSPSGILVYVSNSGESSVSIVDTSVGRGSPPRRPLIRTIQVGFSPHGIAVDERGRFVYVVCQGSGKVDIIDTLKQAVTDHITVGTNPEGIAITPDAKELWVANTSSNTISVLDIATRQPLRVIQIDSPIEVAIAGPLAFVTEANADRVAVFFRKTYAQLVVLEVGDQPIGVAAA